ncbi:MAG: hypothetical protein SFU86_07335 [Pirellulaceae bacterium]|nr:hypothetical protein [Pirellulaceae bacterium]
MPTLADPVLLWTLFAIQLVGLVSMVLARMPHGTLLHGACRSLFVGCLVVVGLATVYAMGCYGSSWAWSGTVFSIMAVGGTADFGRAAPAAF